MDFDDAILKFTVELYNHLNFSTTDIDFIIRFFRKFIKETYNPLLLGNLLNNLKNAIKEDVEEEIKDTFTRFNDPFKKFSSDDKRIRLFKQLGLYEEPEMRVIKIVEHVKCKGEKTIIQNKITNAVHLPLANSLKNLLEINNLFPAMLDYMTVLNDEKTLLVNFIQGTLWQDLLSQFDKQDGIALPLFVYFDDVETGNALGSHAGINELGATYVTIPCLPPNFASKLDSIIVSDLFYTKDRKVCGNDAVFESLIKELKLLRSEGIDIFINNRTEKVYFLTALIVGDNLGLNGILGFVESFSLTHFCRVCYVDPQVSKWLTVEDEKLLRTVASYEKDVTELKVSATGVKGKCHFNELEDFHCIKNQSADVMHDAFEGLASLVMALILMSLIVDEEFFTIDYLNEQLNKLDFDFESSNKPPPIDLDYVKRHEKLKMSASETLFFVRYFAILVGDRVPKSSPVWKLYLMLREIIHIVSSPVITPSDLHQLKELTSNHHSLFIELYGHLRPKFHLMLHYIRIMLKNGPIIKHSSMRFESKHRILKRILLGTASRRNILKTVGTRLQLSLMHLKYFNYEKQFATYGRTLSDDVVHPYFFSYSKLKKIESVTIDDTIYKKGTIFIERTSDANGPVFGKIKNVYIADDEIFFEYTSYESQGFDKHYFSYVVYPMEGINMIKFDQVWNFPCLLFSKEETDYICSRYVI